ncbi:MULTISPECIES: hypothetical protein [Pseudomonadaceae]|uniref:hypothetical protein n=1 Tax=Pseudomonadaceae TaxID=135621 RepID=UPI00103EF2EB|nr:MULTISPECIES: hypothetical protein [Pseudomonadaceae]MCQ4260978.1 hypothetical protein [Stutzerimonas stutzeri]TCD19184.1 hypothetical protein E0D86_19440 [Pseudomonas sp. IC_126]
MFGWIQAKPAKGDNPDLYPLDYDELKKEIDVEQEARRLAVLNSPSPDKTTLSSVEMRIVDRIEEYRSKVVRWSHEHLIYLQRRMSELDITKNVNRARELAEEFKRVANDIISSHDHELRQLDDEARRVAVDLDNFKASNNLYRQPKEPMGGIKKSFWILILISLILIEGLINSNFFSAGLDGGLIEGFTYAGVLAALNVIVSFFIGYIGLKYLWHIKPAGKLWGYASLLIAMAVMLVIALITTHLRDAFTIVSLDGDAMAIAWDRLWPAPFQFQGIQSVLLFGASVFFSICSLAKGLTWGDIYPGYSRHAERLAETRAMHDSKVDLVREELKASKEEFEERLDKILNDSASEVVRLKEHVERKAITGRRMSNYLDKSEHTLGALIELFRTENGMHRKLDTPAYFNVPATLRSITPPEVNVEPDQRDVDRQEALLDGVIAQAEIIRGQIQSAFVLCYDQVTPLRDHLKSAQ